MKRDPALIPLSRQHHKILLCAQLLKKDAPAYKDLPTDLQGKARYACGLFENLIRGHMFQEERTFFPFVRDTCRDLVPLIEELVAEHQVINKLFGELEQHQCDEDTMNRLGHLMEAHVRKEERILFQKIQAELSGEDILKLGNQLS